MTMKRPNVILVLTDDQGYPPLGANGHPFIRTPHLDAFHGEAVRFEQCHSGTTCAPTRAGLFTGRYCNSTGVWHTIGGRSLLRRDEWTLADALRDTGYRTALFGKWHLGDEYPYRPQDRGFETTIVHGGGGIGQGPDWWGNDYFDDTYLVNGAPKAFSGYCTDVFFREAMAFISDNRAAPFFCVISTNAPHSPYNVEPRYQQPYAGAAKTENYARFLGMITNIDENFGALRAHLQTLALEQDTLLMFMSDNGQCGFAAYPEGDAYNAGMRGFKGSMYEGGHRPMACAFARGRHWRRARDRPAHGVHRRHANFARSLRRRGGRSCHAWPQPRALDARDAARLQLDRAHHSDGHPTRARAREMAHELRDARRLAPRERRRAL